MSGAGVVTCFLHHHGAILLLRRADDANTYPGRWAGVSGYIEDEDPRETARREISEETGQTAISFTREGEPLSITDTSTGLDWLVHPFLVDVPNRSVQPNEEIATVEWVSPPAILRRNTVPDLWRTYRRVAPSVTTIESDTAHGAAALSIQALEVLRDVAAEEAMGDQSCSRVIETAEALLDARPSMAVLRNRVNRVMANGESIDAIVVRATEAIELAIAADREAADRAADYLDGDRVFTLSRSGTVMDALRASGGAVLVSESRPNREGVEVAEALADAGLDVTLCTDAAVAMELADGNIDHVLVGADTILPDGRVVNKVGTRAIALVSRYEGVPVHVVAAADKISHLDEAIGESGATTAIYDGPAALRVVNPTFDVTPGSLIDGVITEDGILNEAEIADIAAEHRALSTWQERNAPTEK